MSPGRREMHSTVWLTGGLFWLILFYGLRSVRLHSWPRRVIAVVVIDFASIFFIGAASVIRAHLAGLDQPFSLLPSLQQFISPLSDFYSRTGLVVSALQIWIVSTWYKSSAQKAMAPDNVRAVGLKGIVMSKRRDQSTRLLCASVLLDHGHARERLIGWLKDKDRAVALELRLDLQLAAQLTRFAERRKRLFWWICFGIFSASLVLSFVSVFAWILGAIAAVVLWFRQHTEERDTFVPLFLARKLRPRRRSATIPRRSERGRSRFLAF
jgi:hypothetical protein